jgi:hypothetical protein
MSGNNANGKTQDPRPQKTKDDYAKQLVSGVITLKHIVDDQKRPKGMKSGDFVSIGFSLKEAVDFVQTLIDGGDVDGENLGPINLDGLINDKGSMKETEIGDDCVQNIMDRIQKVLRAKTANKVSVTDWGSHIGEMLRPIASIGSAANALVKVFLPDEHEANVAEKKKERNAKRTSAEKAKADRRMNALIDVAQQLQHIQAANSTLTYEERDKLLEALMQAVTDVAPGVEKSTKRMKLTPTPAPALTPAPAPAPALAPALAPVVVLATPLTIGALKSSVDTKLGATPNRKSKAYKSLKGLGTILDKLVEDGTEESSAVPDDVMQDYQGLIDVITKPANGV